MDDNWEKLRFKDEDLDAQVEVIHIAAYINHGNIGSDNGDPPTNHWTTSLQISGDGSVCLDMMPGWGPDGLRGKIVASSEDCVHASDVSHVVTFHVAEGTTVRNIMELINKSGRQKYTFTEAFEGCRFWIYTVIGDLEKAGVVTDNESAQRAWDGVSYYHKDPTGKEPRYVGEGAFS